MYGYPMKIYDQAQLLTSTSDYGIAGCERKALWNFICHGKTNQQLAFHYVYSGMESGTGTFQLSRLDV